jgi:hypothetical protein
MYHMLLCQEEKTFSLKTDEYLRPNHVEEYTNLIVQKLVLLIKLHSTIKLHILIINYYTDITEHIRPKIMENIKIFI